MKIGLNFGLKTWLILALLLLGFVAVGFALGIDDASVDSEVDAALTAHTEPAGITPSTTRNRSVRLVLFGFAIGIAAILIYIAVFKSPAKASIKKYFHKILRVTVLRDKNSHDLHPPLFLHDGTNKISHARGSSAERITPPPNKINELSDVDEKTPLDDDKK